MDRRFCPALVLILAMTAHLTACSTAREASRRPATPGTPQPPAATAVAPPQAGGLDGSSGGPPPNVCTTLDRTTLETRIGVSVTPRPFTWNDGGVPALDLCALVLGSVSGQSRPVLVGITALAAQPNSLSRLASTLGSVAEPFSELTPDARVGSRGVAFGVGDRVARVTAEHGLTRDEALGIARAVEPAVPLVRRPARESEATCQPATPAAEQFLGVSSQLRRDNRIRSGLTCVWGTTEGTVAIVETIGPAGSRGPLPEAERSPPPLRAPVGDEGYYLPEDGELVFRKGRRVVRVSALADPPRPVSLVRLLDIVSPLMPLFLR